MINENTTEKRIKTLKDVYNKLEKSIDKFSASFPSEITNRIKKQLFDNNELKELMGQIENNRPPRIFLIGKTGVGKSCLVNALCGAYVADVSNVNICTSITKTYSCKDNGRTLMEIMDSRGIDESESIGEITAEEQLQNDINQFEPDVVLWVLDCTNRTNAPKTDIEFMKKMRKKYYNEYAVELPIVVVLNKSDEVPPARIKKAEEYPEDKIKEIAANTNRYKKFIMNQTFNVSAIVPVSSVIDWKLKDGEEISVEKIKELPKNEIKTLEISFDGRYNIDKLRDEIEDSIVDYQAKAGVRMAFKLEELVVRIGKRINKILSGIASVVAATPIPISDISILFAIQSLSVCLIAALSGREISIKNAEKFIFHLGGIGVIGQVFKLIAQQTIKLANGLFPGAGSVISAAIAYLGTHAIGAAAIEYYLRDKDMKTVKKKFKEEQSKPNKEKTLQNDKC